MPVEQISDEANKMMSEIVRRTLIKITGRMVSADNNFLESLNSIEFVSLVVELEDALGIEMEEDKLFADAFPTLSDFTGYLLERKGSQIM